MSFDIKRQVGVINELDDAVYTGAQGVVITQQCKQQWVQHTSLGGSCAQCDSVGAGAANLDCEIVQKGSPGTSCRRRCSVQADVT